jgi:outer membrane protein OmpA-like peptidoglycan-associated protein
MFVVLLLGLSATASAIDVVSENLVFLKEDGRSYLLQRTFRTGWDQYNFYLNKETGPAAIYYVDPPENEWVLDQPDVNLLKFKTGTFTVMYPGDYGERVTVDEAGIYTLNTRDDVQREDGHFGSWNSPNNFTRFVQAWVIPDTFKILGYESNRDGEWVERNNTLTFYATDVNDLTFTVRYQLIDADGDGVADADDRCLNTAEGVVVDEAGCEADTDHDGVIDLHDHCSSTPEGVVVDVQGCELDSDADGVVDSQDKCPGTVAGAEVDRKGCEMDCDGDGVANNQDHCPRTPADTEVNAQGCEIDSDGDGVANSQDECPRTPANTKVNVQGCEVDTDGDGVVNSKDECPDTPPAAVVNVRGCEVDADGDGVVDSADQCQGTPAGKAVDAQGCEIKADGDSDGVVDSGDLCPETAAGVAVDATGCELEKPITLRGVNFHFDSDELTAESRVILDGVAATLLNHPNLKLEVAGHTDSEGVDEFNLDLSQRRSASVRAYLVSRGVNAENLTAQGYGEARPVGSNQDAAGRAANRRVELIRQN